MTTSAILLGGRHSGTRLTVKEGLCSIDMYNPPNPAVLYRPTDPVYISIDDRIERYVFGVSLVKVFMFIGL